MTKYKHLFFSLILLFATELTIAQKPFEARILEEFQETKSDSLFLLQHSDRPFRIDTLDFMYGADTSGNKLFRDLFLGNLGQICGPYETDTSIFYCKILDVENAYKAHIGNIWISLKKGREVALEQAIRILNEAKEGDAYNRCCMMYTEDKNKNYDCDLGWGYNNVMVEPFATEITKHKMGDIYLIETTYGFHIVKSLADPYKERQVVKFVTLAQKK